MKRVRDGTWVGLAALLCLVADAGALTARYGGGSYDGYARGDGQGAVGILWVDNTGGAAGVLTNGATLQGKLWDTGGTQAQVSVYWGLTDGQASKPAWSNRYDFGFCAAQALATNVAGLKPNTLYYYRFYVTNQAGQEAWAATTTNFYTVGPPLVTVDAGATAVGLSTATLNGTLTAIGSSATVFMYWGDNPNAWSAVTNLGVLTQGAYSNVVTGLRAGDLYYYTSYVTNAYGAVWSAVASFRTPSEPARFGGGGYDGYAAMAASQTLRKMATVILCQ